MQKPCFAPPFFCHDRIRRWLLRILSYIAGSRRRLLGGIARVYDVRSSYLDELNEGIAKSKGEEYFSILTVGRIVVQPDMRLSSPVLKQAFVEGAITSGVSVTNLEMVMTPMLKCTLIAEKPEGRAMVTVSRFPANLNGFTPCRNRETFNSSGKPNQPWS
jgi:phosphomannomutase